MKKNDNLCVQSYIQYWSFCRTSCSVFVMRQVIKLVMLAAPQHMLMENGLLSHRVHRTTSCSLPLRKYVERLLFWRRRGVIKAKDYLNLHLNHIKSSWMPTFFKGQLVTVFCCEAVQRFAQSNRSEVWCHPTWNVSLDSEFSLNRVYKH